MPKKRRAFAFTLLAYGVFLIAIGIAGFANDSEKAMTALFVGVVFGGIHLLWSYLWRRKQQIAKRGAWVTLLIVLVVSSWGAWISWQAYFDGDSGKRFSALLVTAMLLGTARVLLRFVTLPR